MIRPSNNPVTLAFGVLVDPESMEKLKGYNKWWISKRGDVITQKQYGSGKTRTRTTYKLHRVLAGAPDGMEIDHINHNKLDNRMANLRICSHAENGRNLSLSKNNTSGVAGVVWDKSRDRWAATIKFNYKNIHLGRFIDKQKAIKAREKAEIKYFGEFANATTS